MTTLTPDQPEVGKEYASLSVCVPEGLVAPHDLERSAGSARFDRRAGRVQAESVLQKQAGCKYGSERVEATAATVEMTCWILYFSRSQVGEDTW